MLEGYRTYLFSGLLFLFSLLYAFGQIDQQTFITLAGIFGAGASYGLREAIKNK